MPTPTARIGTLIRLCEKSCSDPQTNATWSVVKAHFVSARDYELNYICIVPEQQATPGRKGDQIGAGEQNPVVFCESTVSEAQRQVASEAGANFVGFSMSIPPPPMACAYLSQINAVQRQYLVKGCRVVRN